MKKISYLVTTVILMCFLTACSFSGTTGEDFTEFTPEKWENNQWKRKEMIDDLTHDYDLYSMDYDDIVELLGTTGIVESRHVENELITYYVAKTHMDPLLFAISFGEDGKVDYYGIGNG